MRTIKVGVMIWEIISYGNYIITLLANSILSLLSVFSIEKALEYPNRKNVINFPNNSSLAKIKLDKIVFIYHYKYLGSSLIIYS